ncbi:MAG TPA: hypothetical protein VG826_19495 [Pirellulales bacterium]|nr:hypothetical protein [Pirellulales bacterium]
MKFGPLALLTFLLVCLVSAHSLRADDPAASGAAPANSPGIKNSLWQPIFRSMAEDYKISPADKPDRNYKLLLPPVFRWTQPVRGGDDGALFVWLDGGRVMAVGTIFAWPQSDGLRVVQHEFHSFATGPIAATWRGSNVWSPTKGVERTPVPEAPAPATSAGQRLRQIRAIAGGFSGNSVDPDGGRWELRLLSNPFYRYALDKNDSVLDGALFALAQGTDPEVLLLIEAVPKDGGHEWQYCCGRFSDYRLQVRYQGKEIWSVGPCNGSTPGEAYSWHVAERRPKPEPQAKPDGE